MDSERANGYGSERVLGLLDVLDLSDLGDPPSQPRPGMAAAVTAPVNLGGARVEGLVTQTIRYMASAFGFLEFDPAD
jgi:hypothetical protein